MGDTLDTIRDELLARGYQYLTSDPRAVAMVNAGVRRLCARYPWPFLRVAEVNQTPPVALTRLMRIESVVLTQERTELRGVARVNAGDVTYAADTPSLYYVEDGELRVYPVSTRPIDVVYFQIPAALAADADQCVIPAEWTHVVVDFAVREAAKDAHDWETVAGLAGELEAHVGEMLEVLVDQHGDAEMIRITQDESWG